MNVNPFSYLIEKLKSKVSKSGDTMTGTLTINTGSSESHAILGGSNSNGVLELKSKTNNKTMYILPVDLTNNHAIQFPDKDGTLALTNVDTTTASAATGIILSTNTIKKQNNVVTMHLYSSSNDNTATCSAWSYMNVATIPSGYRPTTEISFPLLIAKLDGTWINVDVIIYTSGVIRIYDHMTGTNFTPRTFFINATWIIN